MQNIANFATEKRTEIKNNFKEQIFANELRHHFNLRHPKCQRPTMVFLVVRINREQVKISTGMKVYPSHWNGNRATEGACLPLLESNNNRLLNERLIVMEERFREYKNLVNEGVLLIDKESLRYYISTGTIMSKKQNNQPLIIAKVLLSYLDKDTSIKEGTKQNYTRFIKSFGEYLASYTIYDYSSLTMELMKGFQQWCIENTKGRNGGRASGESVNKKIECTLKCINRYLVGNRLMTGSQFADIQIEPLKEINIDDEIALLDDELTLLYKYKCENKRDEEIRDLFLLECLTGQRFSDVEKVADLVEHKDGRIYFNLIQDKGGNKVQVDIIFQMAINILEKYEYHLPTHNKKIFNKRIKEIAKYAGIKGQELIRYHEADIAGVSNFTKERYDCISSHTGRRTFTTLLSLRGYNDTEIARYTGHASLIMVRRYDKSKAGTKVKEMFERLKIEHPDCILKMVGEQESSTLPNVSSDIERLIIEKYEAEKRLEEEKKRAESNAEFYSIKYSTEIRKQTRIKKLMAEGHTEQEAIEILRELGIKSTEMIRSQYTKNNIQK